MNTTRCQILAVGCLAACLGAQAQQPPVEGHYPAGIEGIRAASLPPKGLYFRDYNYFYTSDKYRSSSVPSDFDAFVYAQTPRLIWMTGWKPLGFDYGLDALAPLVYTDIKVGGVKDSKFGLGDMAFEPLLLSRNFERFDVAAAYGFFAPTGEFNTDRAVYPGKGYWGHMLTLGGTYYITKDKSLSVSLLDRYEFNMEQDKTHLTPGQQNTLEGGLSYSLSKTIDVGLVGYYVQQTTDESGTGASTVRDHVVAAGPEVNIAWPSVGLISSLRYNYEIDAQNRPQGHQFCLTLTYRF